MDPIIKTLIVKKRGRKYFDCVVGDYKAKLVINDVSKDLAIDRVVKCQVNDLSTRTEYGASLKFEPVAILDDRDAEALRKAAAARKEAEKWLAYAEKDVGYTHSQTNAITMALSLCPAYEHLTDRLSALKNRVKINAEAEAEIYVAQKQRREKRRQMRVLFPSSTTPPMNVPARWDGQVIVFESEGKNFRIDADHPSVEGTHLLGHEGDYGRYCYYRMATDEEISILEAREAEKQAVAAAREERMAAIGVIKTVICERGERPEGWNNAIGERLFDTQDIYGAGEWFVINESHIWYVRNNGMDGDTWAANNVLTGGAGAIGWRIAFDADIANRLRELAAAGD